jgi:polyisoprenoid-binding protein YceI
LVLEPGHVEAVFGKRVLVAAAVALGLGDGQIEFDGKSPADREAEVIVNASTVRLGSATRSSYIIRT